MEEIIGFTVNIEEKSPKKVVILGGKGVLARQLFEYDNSFTLLSKYELDLTNLNLYYRLNQFDIIVNTAALINNNDIPGNETKFIDTNIIGVANLSKYCIENNKRLIQISTDYVYPGTGNHKEDDPLLPYNKYAWTKLGSECSVKLVPNHLIIRTSFGSSVFPYQKAYENLYTSKDYVDIIAQKIVKLIWSDYIGIVNVGTERKSIFEYASKRNQVESDLLSSTKDFSLNINLYNSIVNK